MSMQSCKLHSVSSGGWGKALALAAVPLLVGTLASAPAEAQKAPEGPIEITLGTSPGGTPDVLMRRASRMLSELGIVDNPFVIQNRTGGAWMVAINHVLQRPGDENTVLSVNSGSFFATPAVQKLEPAYDKVTPIAMFIHADVVIVVQPDSPYETIEDLIEAARANPRSVSMAGAHATGSAALALGVLESAADIDINYIPFDGGGAATAAFLGGNADMIIVNPNEALPHVEAGKARMLAIMSESRRTEPEFADIPTLKEKGYDALWFQSFGLGGPPDLDPQIVAWWDDKLRQLVQADEWKAALAENFHRGDYIGPDEGAKYLVDHNEMHMRALKAIGAID